MLLEYRITIVLCMSTEFSLMLIPIGVFFFFFAPEGYYGS